MWCQEHSSIIRAKRFEINIRLRGIFNSHFLSNIFGLSQVFWISFHISPLHSTKWLLVMATLHLTHSAFLPVILLRRKSMIGLLVCESSTFPSKIFEQYLAKIVLGFQMHRNKLKDEYKILQFESSSYEM